MASIVVANATPKERKVILVNPDVTTHILMPENVKLVDISTNDIIGDQCADNMVRIKPLSIDSISDFKFIGSNIFMGTITLIGERHVAQYDLVMEPNPENANAYYQVMYEDTYTYSNPGIAMPEAEMARLAWTVFDSGRKFHNIREKQYGIRGEVFNIYTLGDYFFIDFKLTNLTNIPYDIAEMRVNLSDKKQTKATNYQSLELTPLYVLNNSKSFKKDYRQVIVLEKLTFPNDKILNIEIAEDQISGRVITIPIQYDDILHADALNINKIDRELDLVKNSLIFAKHYQERETKQRKEIEELTKENKKLQENLKKGNKEK